MNGRGVFVALCTHTQRTEIVVYRQVTEPTKLDMKTTSWVTLSNVTVVSYSKFSSMLFSPVFNLQRAGARGRKL